MRWWHREGDSEPMLTMREIKEVRDQLADLSITLRAFDERLQRYADSRSNPEQPGEEPPGE